MLKFYPELLQEEINFVNCDGTEFIDTWHVRDYLGSVRTLDNSGSSGGQVS